METAIILLRVCYCMILRSFFTVDSRGGDMTTMTVRLCAIPARFMLAAAQCLVIIRLSDP